MASNYLAKGLKRSALTAALGLCFVGGVQAQSNTAGAVTGRAVAGDTITIENAGTGFSRTITVGSDGNYRLSQVPIGQYNVTRKGTDGSTSTRTASVSVGSAANVSFVTGTGSAQTLDTVTVVGTGAINPIDVSSVESTTILTAAQIAKIPVPRDATSVALLAPGTVKGDAAFGNLASFGGSSVAENAYYVNGFNITNSFKNLNFAQIPFEAVAEQQIKTGGYGAEFGRSTGGVINLITKRGTNEFHAGGNVFYTPEELRETNPNFFTNAAAANNNTSQLISDNSKDKGWEAVAAVWASGALIKDRLFAYGLLQYGRDERTAYPGSTDGRLAANNANFSGKQPTWLVKLDWNISDNHLLEFTGFSDKDKNEDDYYRSIVPASNFTPGVFGPNPGANLSRGAYVGTVFTETGGENFVLKYTGYLTDNFTLSALAGHGEYKRNNYARYANGNELRYGGNVEGGVTGCPRIIDSRPLAAQLATGTRIGCFISGVLFARPDAKDQRDQFRIDAEWQLGDHLLRAGIDTDRFESIDGEADEGGVRYQYATLGGNPNSVRRTIFRTGATVKVEQEAFYIEDSWNVTDNFIAYVGLRWDSFENKNGLDETYVKIDNQFAPRLGFSWDVYGDSSFKVFGNAGRYALPLTATVAVRGASASRFEIQDFTYTGIDPVTNAPLNLAPHPTAPFGDVFFANNEFGLPKNASGFASKNLDPMYQDEYILGFQKQLTDHFSLGVRGIYRDLKRAIDDTCDYHAINEWGEERGLVPSPYLNAAGTGFNTNYAFCHLYNPGSDGIFAVDVDGNGTIETVTIPADRLGPAAKRKYSAIEFFFDGNWDKFFLQGSYTYAKSKGNSEGGVKSDIGQDDTGTTQDFDWPELTFGSYGYLPNDRRHSLKLFGNYDLTDEWSIGANLLVQSGRPINCIGIYANDPTHYTNSYFSCDPGEPTSGVNNGSTIVPRGSAGRLPWTQTLDLSAAYSPNWAEGLQFKVDVFNVFNSRKPVAVNEFGETSAGSPRNAAPNYLTPTAWQTPRAVRFMVQYDF